jgi:hypothetical protein
MRIIPGCRTSANLAAGLFAIGLLAAPALAAPSAAPVSIPSIDVVLVMDNTGSMQNHHVEEGLARWCPMPSQEIADPGCISGDPDSLRGPLLRMLIDSLLPVAGPDAGLGVVLFNQSAVVKTDTLVPLTPQSAGALKDSIMMYAEGQTNYYAALAAARRLLAGSKKPRSLQFIVFLSDGRPNYPTSKQGGDPLMYKESWDDLPVVHCVFMLGNTINATDLHDLADKTGGIFETVAPGTDLASLISRALLPALVNYHPLAVHPEGIVRPGPRPSGSLFDPLGRRARGLRHPSPRFNR